MVLLIDSNVILDVLMNRPGFVEDSEKIWKLCETGNAKGIVSTLTFANLVYVMRKELSAEEIEAIFKTLNLIFKFTSLTPLDLMRASQMKWADYEDAIQSATADRVNADYIVTRNTKDFGSSKVVAISPRELLGRIEMLE